MEKLLKKWYKIDNAGKIFPMTRSKFDTTSFRLACVLKQEVNKDLLFSATKQALDRYPVFKTKMKQGFFWFYLEENDQDPVVKEESPYLCKAKDLKKQNDFLFKVGFFGKRISIEYFHALTDGTGGLEFFKTILYYYLKLNGTEIKNVENILTDEVEQLYDETKDSFNLNYNKNVKAKLFDNAAYKVKGKIQKKNFQGLIYAVCEENSLKVASKKYDATITQYITAVITQAIYEEHAKHDKPKKQKPIRSLIPVNARKFYNSTSLRNFVLFIRTTQNIKGLDLTFDDFIKCVKTDFEQENTKDKMAARLVQNMNFEKNPFVQLVPLFLKSLVAKMVYSQVSSKVTTTVFSNLGRVDISPEFNEYLDRLEFMIAATDVFPLCAGLISFGGKATLSLSSVLIDRKLQKFIMKKFAEDGVNFVVEVNDLEVDV